MARPGAARVPAARALLAAGVPHGVAIFGGQGWRWAWARDVRALVFALDADAAGQQAWRALARQAALRGKRVAALAAAAYGGAKDVSAAWGAGVLTIEIGATDSAYGDEECVGSAGGREIYEERLAIMMYDGHLSYATAACLAGSVLSESTSTETQTC